MRLAETPGFKRPQFSKCDELPEDIKEQLIAASQNRTHSVPDMVRWLNHSDFNGEYAHITRPMLRHWLERRGYRD